MFVTNSQDIYFFQKLAPFRDLFQKDINSYVTYPISKIPASNRYIDSELRKLKQLHETGNFIQRDKEFIVLDRLFYDLKILELNSPTAFKKFIPQLKSCLINEYFGLRLEIHTAAILASHRISFSVSERPDFSIYPNTSKQCFIECTSRHLTKPKPSEILVKSIDTAISAKATQEYMNLNTALFIDITNLTAKDWKIVRNTESGIKATKAFISDRINKTLIGSAICFSWIIDLEKLQFDCAYNRVDHNRIDMSLKNFLDDKYPINQKTIHYFIVPERG